MLFEAKYRAKYWEGPKIFTSKKMPQRLRIPLSQVKPDNTYENLLNEIRQIIYRTWKNIKKPHKSNKIKISTWKWNEELELLDGSYSVSDIQDYFKYIFKKHETFTDNPSVTVYVNKIENRITFKIKTGYYLELLTLETMELLGSTKS